MLARVLKRVGHIKNMSEEFVKGAAARAAALPAVVEGKVYKPSQRIEFNREGEVLLYSCDPLRHETVYLKYPFVMYETLFPLALINYFYNPLEIGWFYCSGLALLSTFAYVPRYNYFFDFKYCPRRIYLLRGGRVLKIESTSIFGSIRYFWVENFQSRPLTRDNEHFDSEDAQFLEEQGQLKYELSVQFGDIREQGVNLENQVFRIKKEGTVHQPELFEAAIKGFNIDTSDFSINTADNNRSLQGHHNM